MGRARHTAVLILGLVLTWPCEGQGALPAAGRMRLRPAIRVDAVVDRDLGAQLGLGVAIASAYNVRLGLDAGVGSVRRADAWTAAGRVDLLARWLSDPFRRSRWGLNAGCGIGQRFESRRTTSTVVIVTLGIEGPSDGRWVPGVELGMGGGVRAGFTFRRAPVAQR